MPWLSLPDYARRTVTPESTVRALIRAGKLEGHQEQRAPGDPRMVWKVWVDDPQGQPQDHPQPSSDSIEGQQPQATATPATDPPAAITGLLELVAADRETMERQAETIAELRERVGRAEARVEWLEDEVGAQHSAADAAIIRAARAEAERDALTERLRLAEEEAARLRAWPWWKWWR